MDVKEYNELMEEQQERSRAAGKGSVGSTLSFKAESAYLLPWHKAILLTQALAAAADGGGGRSAG